jgi:alpha-L-fucosidase 2
MMKNNRYIFTICSLIAGFLIYSVTTALSQGMGNRMSRYNLVWNSPSKDATGVMPIGNGDIAAGVYAIENGDLYLLLSKNDAYTYMGDIFKTGRVRVSLKPNPFRAGKPFTQTLDLATGSIRIKADGITLRIWADANRPVFHVEIHSPKKVVVTVQPDLWKRIDHTVFNVTKFYTATGGWHPNVEPTQDVRLERGGKILWYFPVGDRSMYSDDLKYYNVEQMSSKFPDPFRFNTFGNLLESSQLSLTDSTLVGKGKTFDIRIHSLTMQTPEPSKWIETIESQAAKRRDVRKDWNDHCLWWADFWERSWIVAIDNRLPQAVREKLNGEATASGTREEKDGAALTAQSYNVFRFLMACQSRGRVQAKFNGGLFTQQLRLRENNKTMRSGAVQQADGLWLTNEDDRLWGRRFTFQNQRLLYWPLLASGDYDLMKPFFSYYSNLLEMRKAITKAWFGHDGAYYRENIEPDGAERDCGKDGRPPKNKIGEKYEGWFHDYYFTSGLEILAMMIDNVNYTGDKTFRDTVLLPFAREILLFFDKHYTRGTDGKIRIDPAQVLETWWIAINPAPDIAGLRFCMDELLAMKVGTVADQTRWRKFRGEIPEVPLQTIEIRQAIAPADKWEKLHNSENGELYPVFPFRCYGVGLRTGDIVTWTMKHCTNKDALGGGCWSQDQIDWAYAGNAAEAARGLVRRARIASTMVRFPLFGREGPDSCPDLDQFGSGAIALQRMLVQDALGKILVLPAWPKNWNVKFKLHAMQNTTVEGEVKDGKIIHLKVTPESRRKDVTFGEGWSLSE